MFFREAVVVGLVGLVAGLVGAAGPKKDLSTHPAFKLDSWIGKTHVWYRNGEQPWWVEEDRNGDWIETWYEERLDRAKREVHLKDFARGLRAVITGQGVYIGRADDADPPLQHIGEWADMEWDGSSSTLSLRLSSQTLKSWTLQDGESVIGDFALDLKESSGQMLVLRDDEGNTANLAASGPSTLTHTALGGTHTFPRSFYRQATFRDESPRQVEPDAVLMPGKRIAMLTLNTPNTHDWAAYGEVNHMHYAKKHGYTYYLYRHTMLPRFIVTWNKVLLVQKHLQDHEYVMWIDSDAIVTDMEKKIEDIIAMAPDANFLACGDIGGWMLNTGVMVFKRGEWANKMLSDLWDRPHRGHDQGAEQNQLIQMLRQQDPRQTGWRLFDECQFNCHPRHHKEGHYILHMMGDSGPNRQRTFTRWNVKQGVDMQGLEVKHDEL